MADIPDDSWAFVQTLCFALVLESAVTLCSVYVSPRWYPASYVAKPHNKLLWSTTVAGLVPSVCVPYFAFAELRRYIAETSLGGTAALTIAPTRGLWQALGFSIAHFAFDAVILVIWKDAFIKAMRRPLYIQMICHHVASLVAWPYAFYSNRQVVFVAYFMCSESSNLFLNGRWFFDQLQVGGPIRWVVDLSFFASYVIVRVLPVPVALYVTARADWIAYWSLCSWMQRALTPLIVVPFLLNLFWFKLILKSAKRALAGGKKAPKKAE